MKKQLSTTVSNNMTQCHILDIIKKRVKLAPFRCDIYSEKVNLKSYLEEILLISPTKDYELYQCAMLSLGRISDGINSQIAHIDCSTLETKVLKEEDLFLKEQLHNIIPLAYKIRYGNKDDIIPEFKQVSESPHETTLVVTCKGYDNRPTILATARLDYNPNPEELEIKRFFSISKPFKKPWVELCRFAFHPVFDIWMKSSDHNLKRKANILRGILTRLMFVKAISLFDKEPQFLCTMLRHISLFIRTTTGCLMTPMQGAVVNPENPYFIAEQTKYPQYFIPEQLRAYDLVFDINQAIVTLPIEMIEETNSLKQKQGTFNTKYEQPYQYHP